MLAVVLAALAMLFYIWWRFEWNFAIGAIATLMLDTTKTIGFFALFGLDFNLTAIAALLTIIGYSVNDKVVVYDRMRENLRLYKKMPLRQIIDMSINQVFARCIYTSVAILLSMLPMAIWGGSAVENFADPDGVRRRRRHDLVDLHRRTDPAAARRLVGQEPPAARGERSGQELGRRSAPVRRSGLPTQERRLSGRRFFVCGISMGRERSEERFRVDGTGSVLPIAPPAKRLSQDAAVSGKCQPIRAPPAGNPFGRGQVRRRNPEQRYRLELLPARPYGA